MKQDFVLIRCITESPGGNRNKFRSSNGDTETKGQPTEALAGSGGSPEAENPETTSHTQEEDTERGQCVTGVRWREGGALGRSSSPEKGAPRDFSGSLHSTSCTEAGREQEEVPQHLSPASL